MFIAQLLDCFYGNNTCQKYQKLCSATYAKPKPILSNCNLNYQHANILVRVIYCVVPENVHTPPTEGIGNFGGVGVLKGPNM